MAIKLVPDLGAPVTVAAVDLLSASYAPTYSKWITGAMTVAGYVLGGYMGWGGDFMKNIGIASLPATAKNIYDYVKGTPAASKASRLSLVRNPVSRFPSAPAMPSFGAARLT